MKGSNFKVRYAPPLAIRAARYVSWGVSKALCRIKYHHRENIPTNLSGGLLIVANHQTYFDPFWICAPINRKFRFMAWDKAFDWFIIGWLIRYLGAFPVNTATGRTKNVLRESLAALRDGATLLVFPEGVREFADGRLLEFKTGAVRIALETGVPILPVTVRGGHRIWPQGQKRPRFGKVEVFYHPLVELPQRRPSEDLREYLESQTKRLADIINSI